VRIDLPPGSYVVQFRFPVSSTQSEPLRTEIVKASVAAGNNDCPARTRSSMAVCIMLGAVSVAVGTLLLWTG
jgi:hypothetical protein